jgi:glutamate decarboxylase
VMDNARYLEQRLAQDERFELLTDPRYLPVVVVTAKDPDALDVHALSAQLAAHGWIVPAYTLPPNAEHVDVLRMVVKENFSRDMAELLASNIDDALRALDQGPRDRKGAGPDRPNC